MRRLVPVLVLAAVVTACTSPEATRQRAGGRGGDPGNHGDVVQMHEGSDPYWRTPQRIGQGWRAPIETARHADRLSRGEGEPSASPGPPGR
jgi:hypothetical protein